MSDFIYSLNTSTIRPAALMEKIRIAAEVGYCAIELWNDELTAHVDGGGSLRDVRQALDDQGLSVPTVINCKGWMDSEGDAHRRALEEIKRRMEQAVAVGAGYVIAGPAAGKVDLDTSANRYRELLQLGREIGVRPAMEFLGFVEDISTVAKAWEIVIRAGDPDGTIVMDPFHIFRGGREMEDAQQVPAERIAVCHCNDAPADPPRFQQTDKDRVLPGDGILDLKKLVRILQTGGYRGAISLELFNQELWAQDPREVARIGLEKMRAIVEG